ncbi:unnamed protein product [Prunus armeniaca]|uniref:Uncharacterized protein n=1 Tax=Prunus armeniaca TaxID=36596 RepID=A0A6J5XYK0_PRUAR|nr:unnamed protein product [Prunus armeniaca]
MKEDAGGQPIQKAKIEILLGKSEKFDEIMADVAIEEALEYEQSWGRPGIDCGRGVYGGSTKGGWEDGDSGNALHVD